MEEVNPEKEFLIHILSIGGSEIDANDLKAIQREAKRRETYSTQEIIDKIVVESKEAHEYQLQFLEQLGINDFYDPFCCEIFKGFCSILISGEHLNPETLAKYFRGKVDLETLRHICLEMTFNCCISCTPEVAMNLQTEVESLKLTSLVRQYGEVG